MSCVAAHEAWLCPLLLFVFLALTPLWCLISHRNKYVHEVLYEGWVPVIGAMVISRSVLTIVQVLYAYVLVRMLIYLHIIR